MMRTAHDLVIEAKKEIAEISIEDAQKLLGSETLIVDVREPFEFEEGHVPGAINIPRGMLEFKMTQDEALIDRCRDVLLYCKTSGRAALSAVALKSLGYDHVRSIAGGFDAWAAMAMPTDKPGSLSFE